MISRFHFLFFENFIFTHNFYYFPDEPLAEVTTPQIEALMFPAGAGCSTSGSTGSSDANMSSPDAEITIKADLVKSMNASLPTYDLNTLFSGVQDSGGEAMMTFTGTFISRHFFKSYTTCNLCLIFTKTY